MLMHYVYGRTCNIVVESCGRKCMVSSWIKANCVCQKISLWFLPRQEDHFGAFVFFFCAYASSDVCFCPRWRWTAAKRDCCQSRIRYRLWKVWTILPCSRFFCSLSCADEQLNQVSAHSLLECRRWHEVASAALYAECKKCLTGWNAPNTCPTLS